MTEIISGSQQITPLVSLQTQLLVLQITIAGQPFVVAADCVQKVLPIAAWSAQAGLPENVVGMLRLEHQVLPVVDARACLGFETQLPSIHDHLLLVQANSLFLIWIDRANLVRDWTQTDTLLNLEIFEPAVNP